MKYSSLDRPTLIILKIISVTKLMIKNQISLVCSDNIIKENYVAKFKMTLSCNKQYKKTNFYLWWY